METMNSWIGKKVYIKMKDVGDEEEDSRSGVLKALDPTGIVISYLTDTDGNAFQEGEEEDQSMSDDDTYFKSELWVPWSQILSIEADVEELTYKE